MIRQESEGVDLKPDKGNQVLGCEPASTHASSDSVLARFSLSMVLQENTAET